MPEHPLHQPVRDWFAAHARDLPWRRRGAGAWGVLVSEVMLQQTPVARVLPVYGSWLARWPTPAALAADAPGEAIRAWGRLGYPRRALRLHAAATAVADRHGGVVPADLDALRALPGVGDYTAAAVAAFAYHRRHAVLDTNVRRVLARLLDGTQVEPPGSPRVAERARAEALLPDDPTSASTWSAGLMELGALVCAARAPRCDRCPVSADCAWQRLGAPAWAGPPRRAQPWAGTDRMARGRLMAVLRGAHGPVHRAHLQAAWADDAQRARALAGLFADGLVEPAPGGRYRLPTGTTPTALSRRTAPPRPAARPAARPSPHP